MIVKRIYSYIEKIDKFLKSRFNKTLFYSIIAISSFFVAFNTYAVEQIDLMGIHQEAIDVPVALTGGITSENTQMMSSKTSTATLINIVSVFIPQAFDTYAYLEADPNVSYASKAGAFGVANDSVLAMMTAQPQANVSEHLAQEWIPGYEGGTSSVYADGFSELEKSGIDNLWSRMRNIAYLMFVLVMIVAGFMIMFRSKLGGQTVVTLGNMIPNVIIALILVTFSFAIVGLVIDFGSLLSRISLDLLYDRIPDYYVNTKNPFSIMWGYLSTGQASVWNDIASSLKDPLSIDSVLNITSYIVGGAVAGVGGTITLVLVIIIAGIMVFGAIKVWITLLKSYLGILLNVIIGPIQIAISAIPGQKHMLTNWFLSVLRNVLTFPVVLAMLNLPFALWGEDLAFPGFPEGLVQPSATSEGDGLALLISKGMGFDKVLISILSIVMLFMAAQVPKFLESVFPPNTPKAVGEGVGAAKAAFSKIPLVGKLFA
jgi:hypothetical protein